jgi:hypothetical protein
MTCELDLGKTMLRKSGTPEDLQKQWIGHSSLRTTDRYSHTRNLNTDVSLQAKQDLISLLDPMDPIWGLRRPRKKAA